MKTNQTKKQKEFEKILDKYTTNLTSTHDEDDNEIISFDKVVFEKYKASLDLWDWIQKYRDDEVEKILDRVKSEVIGENENYDRLMAYKETRIEEIKQGFNPEHDLKIGRNVQRHLQRFKLKSLTPNKLKIKGDL